MRVQCFRTRGAAPKHDHPSTLLGQVTVTQTTGARGSLGGTEQVSKIWSEDSMSEGGVGKGPRDDSAVHPWKGGCRRAGEKANHWGQLTVKTQWGRGAVEQLQAIGSHSVVCAGNWRKVNGLHVAGGHVCICKK